MGWVLGSDDDDDDDDDESKRSSLKYWRPISLLNVDYKVVSKSLANRLSRVLHIIVSEDQTCSVPGRSIIDNLHLIRGVFDFVGGRNISCGLNNFDQKKAFDRVSHMHMFRALLLGSGPPLYPGLSSYIIMCFHQF